MTWFCFIKFYKTGRCYQVTSKSAAPLTVFDVENQKYLWYVGLEVQNPILWSWIVQKNISFIYLLGPETSFSMYDYHCLNKQSYSWLHIYMSTILKSFRIPAEIFTHIWDVELWLSTFIINGRTAETLNHCTQWLPPCAENCQDALCINYFYFKNKIKTLFENLLLCVTFSNRLIVFFSMFTWDLSTTLFKIQTFRPGAKTETCCFCLTILHQWLRIYLFLY